MSCPLSLSPAEAALETALETCAPRAKASGSGLRGLFTRFLRMRALAHQRRQLARLDPALLDDIGITRDQARREAGRPAWDAPAHWKLPPY